MAWRRRKSEIERSGSGQPVIRHELVDRGLVPAAAPDHSSREALEHHLEQHLGPISSVWHEIASHLVHIDVYMWRPTAERPMYTFVTGGMSDLPMTIPKGAVEAGVSERAELMVCLPASWPVPDEAHVVSPWADDDAYVPIRSLKELARLPHEYATWLGFGHSIPNGDPPRRLTADTALCGWIVLPPMTVPSSFRQLTIDGAGTIDIFAIIAVHADEMHHKLAHGTEALFHGFDHHNVNELLDLQRPSSLR